jgi:hypothetical protein
MHPMVLYNQIGARLDGDAYDIGAGFDRKEVKAGIMIGLNAADESAAVKAQSVFPTTGAEKSSTPFASGTSQSGAFL